MQLGAYITDGIGLYEVGGIQRGPGVIGMSTVRILVENCRNLRFLEFLPDKIRCAFDLVRPAGRCPDVLEDISWEPDGSGGEASGLATLGASTVAFEAETAHQPAGIRIPRPWSRPPSRSAIASLIASSG
jgi:hypothetical protein